MPTHRYENLLANSSIKAIVTCYGDSCGRLGPYFTVHAKGSSLIEMSLDKLAGFLNKTTEKTGKIRSISKEVEEGIVKDFSDFLKKENERYVYCGPVSAAKREIVTLPHTCLFSNEDDESDESDESDDISGRYTGIIPKNVILPSFNKGIKVLDVGAGNGYMTARLRDELGCDAYALEPNIEEKEGYEHCVKLLGKDHAFKLTLQEAVEQYPEQFCGQFDAITIFKYNIPMEIKDDFCKQLAMCLKPNGQLFITSVEEARMRYNKNAGEKPFIMDSLRKYFNSVNLRDQTTASYCVYGAVECLAPRQDLVSEDKKGNKLKI